MNENKNFCTKCECYFTQPGTCNCFAPVQAAPALPYVPYIPTYPTCPVYPFGTPILVGPSPTTTVAPMIGNDITVVSNSVRADQVQAVSVFYTEAIPS